MSFPASYRRSCTLCVDPIEVLDLIDRYGGGYAHAQCAADDQIPVRTGIVCTRCFIEKPCECDDEKMTPEQAVADILRGRGA